MISKNILIINGHPNKESFCSEIAKQYETTATKNGAIVNFINLIDLNFDLILKFAYKKNFELEPDLVKAQELIKNSDHIVFTYPNWWGTYPALLKAFIEKVFLPDFAFSYQKNSPLPKKLLIGKSARIFVTMDTPKWYYKFVYSQPGHNSMKKSILNFCGINPVRFTTFTVVRKSNKKIRRQWLEKVEKLAKNFK